MAVVSGQANNYLHLYDIFINFALANGWTMLRDSRALETGAGADPTYTAGEVYMKGTGTSGSDNIHIQMTTGKNVTLDSYSWNMTGATGYQNGLIWGDQPGVLLYNYPGLALWNQPIDYWIVANGRRLILVAKVSTVYVMIYLGFILPYATPNQYPYPLVIGGSHTSGIHRWSETGNAATIPVIPFNAGAYTVTWVRLPNGTWFQPAMDYYVGGGANYRVNGTWPYNATVDGYFGINNLSPTLSGEYTLQPIILCHSEGGGSTSNTNALGEFEGVYHVAGRNNAAENIITIGGQQYLVFQNVYRNGLSDYACLKLS